MLKYISLIYIILIIYIKKVENLNKLHLGFCSARCIPSSIVV